MRQALVLILGIMLLFSEASFCETAPSLSSLKSTSKAFNSVAEKGIKAVVSISTVRTVKQPFSHPFFDYYGSDPQLKEFFGGGKEFKRKGLGSGVIVSSDGYILTNHHVIDKMEEITVTLSDNREFKARVIGRDPKTDLALLKIDGSAFPTVSLADSDQLKVGDWAIAIGNPFGLDGTVTVGIISATGRSEVDIVDYSDLIQTDAAINPGNSGGALLNIDGELVGINTAIYSRSGGYLGIGFAVPSNMALRVMEDLKSSGTVVRGWLGVFIQPITPLLKEQFGLDTQNGALVSDVVDGSPAEKAGLQRGDVISTFNSVTVADFKSLRSRVSQARIGEKIQLGFIRRGESMSVSVVIDSSPQDQPTKSSSKVNGDRLGLRVISITPDVREKYQLKDYKGVVVSDVVSESSAARAGIAVGDVILEVNRQTVRRKSDYRRAVRSVREGDRVLVAVRSKGVTQYLILE